MRYETRGVLAGRYKGKRANLENLRTHVLDTQVGGTLCGILEEHLADANAGDVRALATCPKCARRDPRTNSGPQALAHHFSF